MEIPTANIEKALSSMRENNLECLLIVSDGSVSILRPSYLHYWAGYHPLNCLNIAVLDRQGRSVLLVQPSWDAPRASGLTWIEKVIGTRNMVDDLSKVLDEMGCRGGSIGVAGHRYLSADAFRSLESRGKVQPCEALFDDMAREKTEAEIDNARKVGKIADAGFQAFLNNARPGIREYELAAEVEYSMRMAGSDDNFILMSSDTHNYEMHEPSERRLRLGDIVIGEITPIKNGQFLQVCRTVVVGRAAPVVKEKYALLITALRAALDKVKPMEPAGSISKAMNQVLIQAGYHKYCYPPYMRARGHGFGVGSIAPGAVIEDSTAVAFHPGQVVVVHPNQYLPETGYLACGETVLVTESGFERLSESESILYEWGA